MALSVSLDEDEVYVDEEITLKCTFASSGDNEDPASVTLELWQTSDPSGTLESYTSGAGELDNPNTGVWQYDKEFDTPGEWRYSWLGQSPASDSAARASGIVRVHNK